MFKSRILENLSKYSRRDHSAGARTRRWENSNAQDLVDLLDRHFRVLTSKIDYTRSADEDRTGRART